MKDTCELCGRKEQLVEWNEAEHKGSDAPRQVKVYRYVDGFPILVGWRLLKDAHKWTVCAWCVAKKLACDAWWAKVARDPERSLPSHIIQFPQKEGIA